MASKYLKLINLSFVNQVADAMEAAEEETSAIAVMNGMIEAVPIFVTELKTELQDQLEQGRRIVASAAPLALMLLDKPS